MNQRWRSSSGLTHADAGSVADGAVREAVTEQGAGGRTTAVEDPWREVLGPILDGVEVQRRLGVQSPEELDELVRNNRLLALPTEGGDRVFPEFQFVGADKTNPTIARVIGILGAVVATPYTIASWLQSPKDHLGGEAPVRWLELERDPEQVVAAAELTAARLAQ